MRAFGVLRRGGGVQIWPPSSASSFCSNSPYRGRCRTAYSLPGGVARPESNVFSFGVHRSGRLRPATVAPLRSHVPRPKTIELRVTCLSSERRPRLGNRGLGIQSSTREDGSKSGDLQGTLSPNAVASCVLTCLMRPCALHRSLQMPNICACGCGQRVAYYGIYRKGHQPPGTSRDPAGKQKAANDINNPINNPINHPIYNPIYNPIYKPINNKRVQEATRVENEERITKMGKDEPIITEAMAADIAETLSTSPLPIFKGLTPRGVPAARKRPRPAGGRCVRLLLRLHGPSDRG